MLEELLCRALDLGGTLVLAILILMQGGKKLDQIEEKLAKLIRLTAMGLNGKPSKKEVNKIMEGEK